MSKHVDYSDLMEEIKLIASQAEAVAKDVNELIRKGHPLTDSQREQHDALVAQLETAAGMMRL